MAAFKRIEITDLIVRGRDPVNILLSFEFLNLSLQPCQPVG